MNRTLLYILALLIVVGGALYFRIPTINQGMPYFYDEDEAHHFNRTMNMAKSGDLNPHYFHKPSLHFYLRLPVVWGAYLYSKRQGYLKSLDEVRTFDRYGIADFSFTASHPTFVKANRAWSVVLSLLLIILAALIAWEVSGSYLVALFASSLCALSPSLIEYSGVIGVDILMAVMCLASVYMSLRLSKKFSSHTLFFASFFAGLAVSSKYNAAPIIFAPLIGLLVSKNFSLMNFFRVGYISGLAFFLGSPYILISIDEFINHLKYEVWHYAVAGHVGHMAEPGLEQAAFYYRWLSNQAIGFGAVVFALLALPFLLIKKRAVGVVFLTFPLLFFVLMIAQKANFVRNMLVLIPFLCILAGYFAVTVLHFFRKSTPLVASLLSLLLFLMCAFQPLTHALQQRIQMTSIQDSRNEASKWLLENNQHSPQTALSGYLQLPAFIRQLKNFATVDQDKTTPLGAYLLGFDRIVYLTDSKFDSLSFLKLDKAFNGVSTKERIVQKPAISIFSFAKNIPFSETTKYLESLKSGVISFKSRDGNWFECQDASRGANGEDYCWSASRIFGVHFPGHDFSSLQPKKIELEIMSPWSNQKLSLLDLKGDVAGEVALTTPGQWTTGTFELRPEVISEGGLVYFANSIVMSPAKESDSTDVRRLGMAIRKISF